jgi:hypothetical protein
VKPLSKDLLVPGVFSDHQFELFRMLFIAAICFMRGWNFRQQVQFKLNESYLYVEKFMQDSSRKLFDYIRYRMSANFLETWFIVYQNATAVILPLFLLMIEYQRYLSFAVQPN